MCVGCLIECILDVTGFHLAHLVLRKWNFVHAAGPVKQSANVPLRGRFLGVDVFAERCADLIHGFVLRMLTNARLSGLYILHVDSIFFDGQIKVDATPFGDTRPIVLTTQELIERRVDGTIRRGKDQTGEIAFFENALPGRIELLPLVIHRLVPFEQVLPRGEIAFLHLALGVRDALGEAFVFQARAFREAELFHHLEHPIGHEQFEEVILEGEREPRRTGITLTAGATA